MTKQILIIDGSYFCFHRYYATKRWWGLSHPDEPPDASIDNDEFVEKFKKTFSSKLKEIYKQLHLNSPTVFVAKDCHRKDIWRKKFYPEYKNNRVYDESFKGGPFFTIAYENDGLFCENNIKAIIEHPHLEADDCISIIVKKIIKTYDDCEIFIIANDADYLQLCSSNVKVYDMAFKCLNDSKKSYKNPEKDLFCKIIRGDKSDNIAAIKKGLGTKRAESIFDNRIAYLNDLQKTDPQTYNNYILNKKLIDFNEIPENYALYVRNIILNKFLLHP